jgi:hypothetical protein
MVVGYKQGEGDWNNGKQMERGSRYGRQREEQSKVGDKGRKYRLMGIEIQRTRDQVMGGRRRSRGRENKKDKWDPSISVCGPICGDLNAWRQIKFF